MRRRLTALLLATACAIGLASGPPPTSVAAPAAAAETKPLRYVALGDSYSAASGVLPLDLTAPVPCLRSTRNYPHVIAERTGARLRDVTCGGADTGDYFGEQYPGVAPQLDALRKNTQLVTMTIGGNDSGVFLGAIVKCGAAGVSTLGQGSPCRRQYGNEFERTVRTTTYPDLVRSLRAVRKRSPRAEVAILGYPWIVPETGGCFTKMPIARGDVPYLRGLQTTLNNSVRRAARATGATYVDLSKASDGHDACKPIGVRWIEPILQGTNPVIVHPNAFGEKRMADRTMRVLNLR